MDPILMILPPPAGFMAGYTAFGQRKAVVRLVSVTIATLPLRSNSPDVIVHPSQDVVLSEHDLFGKPVSTHRVVARGHAFPGQASSRWPARSEPGQVLPARRRIRPTGSD